MFTKTTTPWVGSFNNPPKQYCVGGLIQDRVWKAEIGYKLGFQGQEKDDEVSGTGNQYDYGFRVYNPRIGKFLSMDPLFRSYPWYTPYQFAGNKPICAIDLDGLEEIYFDKSLRGKMYNTWIKVWNVQRQTSGGQGFCSTSENQSEYDIYYFATKKPVDGFTISFSSCQEYLDYKYIGNGYVNSSVANLDDETIQKYFELNEGKTLIMIGINKHDLEILRDTLKDGDIEWAKEMLIELAHTLNHEEVAYAERIIDGTVESNADENEDYQREKSDYSPDLEEIRNDPQYEDTIEKESIAS